MRFLMSVLMLVISFSAQASVLYSCVDEEGNTAELVVHSKKNIEWNEPWHSAGSSGVFSGKEEAPFSEIKGYFLYQLTSFYMTNDSAFYVALSSTKGPQLKAVVYFDNDDHYEDETEFLCTKQ